MQNLNLSPGSKEYNFNNKKVLENSGSLSNCNTKKKIDCAVVIIFLRPNDVEEKKPSCIKFLPFSLGGCC